MIYMCDSDQLRIKFTVYGDTKFRFFILASFIL